MSETYLSNSLLLDRREKRFFALLLAVATLLVGLDRHLSAAPVAEIYSAPAGCDVYRDGNWEQLRAINAPQKRQLSGGEKVRTLTNAVYIRYYPGVPGPSREITVLPHSEIQMPEKDGPFDLVVGLFHFLGRTTAQAYTIKSKTVQGAATKTDFMVRVDADGKTLISVAVGEVLLTNSFDFSDSLAITNTEAAWAAGGTNKIELIKSPSLELRDPRVRGMAQTFLYYPGILHLDDLGPGLLSDPTLTLSNSVNAYSVGNLPSALAMYPTNRPPENMAQQLYLASLVLTVGDYPKAVSLLTNLDQSDPGYSKFKRIADALSEVMAAAQGKVWIRTQAPTLATEWLAESYYQQSRADREYLGNKSWEREAYRKTRTSLERALVAAKKATPRGSQFGFGWVRRAELEFGFGRIRRAVAALEQSGGHQRNNAQAVALHGFLDWAANDFRGALAHFREAVALDSRLGNAWLGLGLTEFHQEDIFQFFRRGRPWDNWRANPASEGLRHLEAAAAAEPERSLLRSYLGKAYFDASGWWGQDSRLRTNALEQLELANYLDTNDPTPLLYSALLKSEENKINPSIADLEKSERLNYNRQAYRSGLLLDQDLAVRSANLASIYRDAGMTDVSVREAAQAVTYDYANPSAHLFLADSYNELRDPTGFNLRYETVWYNQWLLANLLAPVGGGRLAQHLSEQEYSKLFESDGLGLANSTMVRTDGQVQELASQYGTFSGSSYALDLDYQHNNGVRPNNDLNSIEWQTTLQQQITPQDTAFALFEYRDYSSGDNFQYYDPAKARKNFRYEEYQDPIAIGAWHHEWSPQTHTLVLGGRLVNQQHFSDPAATNLFFDQISTGALGESASIPLNVDYHNQLEIYTVEANQIMQWNHITLSVGSRYQSGTFQAQARMDNFISGLSDEFYGTPTASYSNEGFERFTGYGYFTVEPLERLWLTGGFAYDDMTYPRNFRAPPLAPGEDHSSQLGPKAALVWSPLAEATLRGVFTRSLGGVSLDESYRLEPTQLAGFPQAFRSLISESLVGSVAAPEYQTFGLALDLKFPTRTYAGIQAQRLEATVNRDIGVFTLVNGHTPYLPDATREQLDYRENSLTLSANQLVGDWFAVGASYTLAQVELHDVLPNIPISVLPSANMNLGSDLHHVSGYILFNHPSGLFARAETHWYGQENSGYSPAEPGDHFFQDNLFVGYRFPRRHAQLELGILNLEGRDYHLSPLTAYMELPRSRTFMAKLDFQF